MGLLDKVEQLERAAIPYLPTLQSLAEGAPAPVGPAMAEFLKLFELWMSQGKDPSEELRAIYAATTTAAQAIIDS